MQNGAAPSTVLHGPGNSQPHKAAPCSGGHEVDVHALKAKRSENCGTQPPSSQPPRQNPTPDPGEPGNPAHGSNVDGNGPATPLGSGTDPQASAKPGPAVSPKQGGVESAGGVLSATGPIGSGTLPFTGFPIWLVVVIALALIAVGVMLRRRSRAPAA
jgi:hypothetical protein